MTRIATTVSLGIASTATFAQNQRQGQDEDEQQVAAAGLSAEANVFSLDSWEYGDLYSGWRADELLEADVIDASGEDVGDVANLLLNEMGQIVQPGANCGARGIQFRRHGLVGAGAAGRLAKPSRAAPPV